MEHKECAKRTSSIEENLRLFDLLLAGDSDHTKFCLR